MPKKKIWEKTLEHLLSKLVDETIEADELQSLEQMLDGNPEAQSQYLRYLDPHSELLQNGGEIPQAADPITPKKSGWLPVALTAAAGIAIAGFIFISFGEKSGKPIVEIVDSGGPAEWEGWNSESKINPQAGVELPAGTIETFAAESWIELAFPDGTSASLTGPSVLNVAVVDGRKILRLKKGNLSVDAAKQPVGRAMKIHTPSAEAEVVGTRFNLATNAFSTQLTVNEGKVRMTRLADGKVEEVVANEELVAALEKGTSFSAAPRPVAVHSWISNIPRDAIQGRPEISTNGVTGIRAEAHIWKGEPNAPSNPVLLYSAVFDPSPRKSPPVQIVAGSQINIQGRMDRSERIHAGFATKKERGGFAGKYAVFKGSPVEIDADGKFQIEVPVSSFVSTNPRFPESPIGQEMMYLWIQTVKSDAGLVIESVEIKK